MIRLKISKKYLFLGLATCQLVDVSAQQSKRALSLNQCIEIAESKSTAALKSNIEIQYAGAGLLAAYGQFLPNLTLGAGANYDHGNNYFSSVGTTLANMDRLQYNYQLVSSINIFSGYANKAGLQAAQLNKKMAEFNLERAKQQIAFDVSQSFLQITLDKKIVETDSVNLGISLKREDQLKTLVEIGRKAKTDLYQQQAQTGIDRLNLIRAVNKLENDKIILLQKLRIDSFNVYDFEIAGADSNAEAAVYGNVDQLISAAHKNRPDLKASEANIDYFKSVEKGAESFTKPSVLGFAGIYNAGGTFNALKINGIDANINGQENIGTQLYKYTYGLAGINANWTLFNRYATKANIQKAKLNIELSEIDNKDSRIKLMADIKTAYNDYKNAVLQLETVDQSLFAAQQAYEAVSERYKQGVSDFITLVNSQSVLLLAQQNKINATLNLMLQKKVLNYLIGR